MKEYEYSMKVDSLDKYINFCENNNYVLKENYYQIRTIYRNDNNMARITISKSNDSIKKELDFKESKLSDDELIVRKETLPIEFTNDDAINSILEFLNYKKDNTVERKRYVYEYNNEFIIELDEYIKPNHSFVVSLEGKINLADSIWQNIKGI